MTIPRLYAIHGLWAVQEGVRLAGHALDGAAAGDGALYGGESICAEALDS
ncbi:MAG TPA: hypothetical protein VGO79_14035 [Thermoanaerobaculia bacterium]|jgi:hypothetical protein